MSEQVKKKIDVNRDFALPIVLALQNRVNETSNSLIDSNYEIGFSEGFNFGVEEGKRRAQLNMRQAMGICEPEDYGAPRIHYADYYRQFAKGSTNAKEKSDERTIEA